ncbi:unnamed protein product, partial [Meganyctiphanes norvegica]
LCEYRCETRGWLKRHMYTHEGGKAKAYQPPTFNGQFKEPLPVTPYEDKPHACTECDFRTKNPWNLTLHTRKHHMPKEIQPQPPGEPKPFACTQCDFTAANQGWLNRHMINEHRSRTTYDCAECKFSCKSEMVLQKHLAEHRGEREFCCNYCEFKSYSREERELHVLSHTLGKEKK